VGAAAAAYDPELCPVAPERHPDPVPRGFMTNRTRRPAGPALALLLSAALAGCSQLPLFPSADRTEREPVPGLPSKHSFPVSQFVFVSDLDIQRNLPIFRELSNLREQVYKELRLPPSSTKVLVYLFEDAERYERFMKAKYPELPRRRAFFLAQPKRLGGSEDLLVYTYWGDRINQDLRHELTHAMLHSVLKDVPLWLDEGLAEFFEVPANWNGVNLYHIDHLRQPGVRFDLARLEALTDVQQMTPAEYREAWAWVHLMLRSTPAARQALLSYVQELRTNPQPGPLRPRLAAMVSPPEAALRSHLSELETSRPRTSAALRP
jgi:Protein of unknown function (DUF1570)